MAPQGNATEDKKESENEVYPKIPETESFLEDSAPKDKYNIVLYIMLLHGIGTLIAWNVFITIAPLYYIGLKLKSDPSTTEKPSYETNFMNYVCICSQIPNLIINAVGMFSSKGNLMIRIVASLAFVAASTVFTIAFVYVDTSSWKFGFFVLTMVSVMVLNAANGFYQNSIFGLVGSFPGKYINAVVLGNNFCGLFVTILSALTTYFIQDVQLNAAVYFSIAFLLLLLCIASFLYVRTNPYFKYQVARAQTAADAQNTELGLTEYLRVFKACWPRLINVFYVFFITLLLFPSVMLDIKLYPNDRKYDLLIPENMFALVFVFINFNVCTVIGSKLADFVQWPSRKYVWIPIYGRTIFVILLLFANYVPSGYRTLPVLVPNEWSVFVIISLMSISHGYLSSLSMMYAPQDMDAATARTIGKMSSFFIVSGVAAGIAASFLANLIVHI